MPLPSAVASAGSLALSRTQGAHATSRLDAFLRSTDAVYQHAEAPQAGDRFIRQMATYGQVRPSASFISESRVRRPWHKDSVLDMSALPATWHGPRSEQQEGTLVVERPKEGINMDFLELYKNDKLMTPSERREEAAKIVEGERKFKEQRKAHFAYNRAIRTLEMQYPDGVVGLDGPMYPDTRIYAERRALLQDVAARKQQHAEGRFSHLAEQVEADDASALGRWGSEPNLRRSQDICIPRKLVDPVLHPTRFHDTHDRIFPKHTSVWDPERAASLRSHDIRDTRFNIVTGTDNAITFNVAKNWGLPDAAEVVR